MTHMIKPKRKLDSGFTIVELGAVIAISMIIFLAIYIVLSMWSLRFQQLSQIARLNNEAYDCIMKIKHGAVVKQDNNPQRQFIGLLNARSLSMYGNSATYQTITGGYVTGYSGVKFKPPLNHPTLSNYDEVTIVRNGDYVMYDGAVYGIDSNESSNIPLFPSETSGGSEEMFVENLIFTTVGEINTNEDDLKVVRVILKAGIKLSEGNLDVFQSYPDPYFVEYETIIAIEQGAD